MKLDAESFARYLTQLESNPKDFSGLPKPEVIQFIFYLNQVLLQNRMISLFIFDMESRNHIWVNEGYKINNGITDSEADSSDRDFYVKNIHQEDFRKLYTALLDPNPTGGIYSGHYRKMGADGIWGWHCAFGINLGVSQNGHRYIFGITINVSQDVQINDQWNQIARENFRLQNQLAIVHLTKREKEILLLFSKGHSQKEIADQLCISFYTVETHKKHLFKKLNKNSITELVAFTIEAGLHN